jgi:hypothetical protein
MSVASIEHETDEKYMKGFGEDTRWKERTSIMKV